ncbi:MAG: D-alanyl-D-alanine carboxypeptidase/D-alanyl-D-alanine-endopeptidase [Prevotella sp.]|nr:D-alanyl-D-alanine carboxypeptidase/D-alanyl-D-alanine-endopeptidase [Prevotella sp.]
MKKNLLIILSLCLSLPLWAQTDTLAVDSLPWPQRLKQKLDSILLTPMLQTSQLGLMVYDLTADSTLYTCGHRQTLRPASTMKLLTAITGIELLGADYRLETSLHYTGTITGGTLDGHLYCVGGMDPLFDRKDMTAFVNKVRHLGVDTIRGRILADESFKDSDRLGEGWCWDDDNPVLSPLLYARKDQFAEQLQRELQRDGVVIIDTACPPSSARSSARRYVCSRSHGLDELLVPMMKESDNLYAEALFYQIAASADSRPAKGKQAANQVKRMIQKVGLRPSDYRVADGSGLSLYNYVSAELEVRLLRYAWRHKEVYDLLLPSLPIAGVDGTLKNRMYPGPAAGNVHAKTGTVSGISSLAGYCTAPNGHQLAFCIINQGVMRTADGRSFQDRVCRAMCELKE